MKGGLTADSQATLFAEPPQDCVHAKLAGAV